MRQLRVGLTGGLASGKSTVASWMRAAGFEVVDADLLVAELYRPGGQGAAAVADLFGTRLLKPDGAVDRQRLAAKVFGDPEARHRLEAIIHPLVGRRFDELTRELTGVVVLEATLLVEAGMASAFDIVVTVEADPDLRVQRAVERGLERVEAARRMEAQATAAARLAVAHRVLRNNGSLKKLRDQVDQLITDLERQVADEP